MLTIGKLCDTVYPSHTQGILAVECALIDEISRDSEVNNMIEYSDLNAEFIIKRFPELKEQVEQEMSGSGEFLPHVIFGNVFNQLTVSLLKRDDYLTNKTLNRIFDMYEELSSKGDDETQNLVQVTLLEYLWDERTTYDRALELIGDHTRELWNYIYAYISIP